MNANQLLRKLGFSDYEARAYVSLVGAGVRSGYEVAKHAAMPRANVYAVLRRLSERGAVQQIDTPDGVRYAAVDPPQLVRDLDADHRRTLAAVEDSLAAQLNSQADSPVVNLSGYHSLVERARSIIDATSDTLHIAIQPGEAQALAVPLREARERGVTIVTLCMEACSAECGGCQGDIYRHDLAPSDQTRWLVVVADNDEMLAGEITAGSATGVVTQRRLVIELADAYICQSLALATVEDELGDEFDGLLSGHARALLNTIRSEGAPFARMTGIGGGKRG